MAGYTTVLALATRVVSILLVKVVNYQLLRIVIFVLKHASFGILRLM